MTGIDLDKADDETIERFLYANRGVAQAAEREAIQLARSVIQIHPDPLRMRVETNDFARRMSNLGMVARYRLAKEMLQHFKGRDAEARALAEAEQKRNFERVEQGRHAAAVQAHWAQWAGREGAALKDIAGKVRAVADEIEVAVLSVKDHAGLKAILDMAERRLGEIKGQEIAAEHKVIRAALAKAEPSSREAA